MPTLADLLNAPSDFEFEGTVYKLREPTLMECGRYQRWLEQEARASAARAVELPDEDRRNLLRDVTADIAAQVYAWGGEACVRSLRTPQGIARLLAIIGDGQGITPALAARMVDRKLREIAALLAAAQEDDAGGKKLEAVALRLGLPRTFFATPSPPCATPPSDTPPTSKPSGG
jgi:hypothetical protein